MTQISGIMNYLDNFSLSTADVHESFGKLTSTKAEWIWNNTYQKLYKSAKVIIRKDASMKFYNEREKLYLEINTSGVRLGAGLPQTRERMCFPKGEEPDNSALWPIAYTSKSLISAKIYYNYNERDALHILHSIEKFHHYCFIPNISVITNHESLVAITKKDIVSLSHRLQRTWLCIHQYYISTLYKAIPKQFVAKWLSIHSYSMNRDEEIPRISLNLNALVTCAVIPEYMIAEEIRHEC